MPHALYGHVPFEAEYSVGDWLRAVAPLLQGELRPIVVGGTGLYFRALTEGLAEIPPIPDEIRAEAAILSPGELLGTLRQDDPATAAKIDTQNPRSGAPCVGRCCAAPGADCRTGSQKRPRRFCRWTASSLWCSTPSATG